MTGNYFLDGFMDELEKQAAHPLLSTVTKSGTLLGRKVKGMMTRAKKVGQKTKYRMKKKAEESSDKAGKTVKRILEEAEGDERARMVEGEGGQVLEQGAEDTKYGGGLGNLGKKRAPAFTDKVNPPDMPGAFGKQAQFPSAMGGTQKSIKENPRMISFPKGSPSNVSVYKKNLGAGPVEVAKAPKGMGPGEKAHYGEAAKRLAAGVQRHMSPKMQKQTGAWQAPTNAPKMGTGMGKKAEMEKCSKCAGKGCPHCKGKGVHEKQAKAMCGPKYGCGKGVHGTGCGLRKKAADNLKMIAQGTAASRAAANKMKQHYASQKSSRYWSQPVRQGETLPAMDMREKKTLLAKKAGEAVKEAVSWQWVARKAARGSAQRMGQGAEGIASLQRSQRRLRKGALKSDRTGDMAAASRKEMDSNFRSERARKKAIIARREAISAMTGDRDYAIRTADKMRRL